MPTLTHLTPPAKEKRPEIETPHVLSTKNAQSRVTRRPPLPSSGRAKLPPDLNTCVWRLPSSRRGRTRALASPFFSDTHVILFVCPLTKSVPKAFMVSGNINLKTLPGPAAFTTNPTARARPQRKPRCVRPGPPSLVLALPPAPSATATSCSSVSHVCSSLVLFT